MNEIREWLAGRIKLRVYCPDGRFRELTAAEYFGGQWRGKPVVT